MDEAAPGGVPGREAAVGVACPQDCVYVGDRPFDDVHGAHQAGLRTVLIPNRDVPAFAGAEPDATIGRLGELICRVNRIRHAHRALQFDRGLTFHETDNPNIALSPGAARRPASRNAAKGAFATTVRRARVSAR